MFARAILLLVAIATVHADSFTTIIATGQSTPQPISLFPTLVLDQTPPNHTFATAQIVSPLDGALVLGSLTPGHPQEVFSFNLAAGVNFFMQVSSTTSASQLTGLELVDPNGNLVAVASGNGGDGFSSDINFNIPTAGSWQATVFGPNNNFYNYGLLLGPPTGYSTDVLGRITNLNNSDYYAISTNTGDNLHLSLHSTLPVSQTTEVLLFDSAANLVAIASGNGIDGLSSVIDFTIPVGGYWYAGVMDPTANLYSYDLGIQGATGTGTFVPTVPVSGTVPEPSFGILTGCGLIGLALARRRRSADVQVP